MYDQNTKEIADKLLDMTKAGLIEVYAKIQQVAPDLWKLVIRQKMIDGIELFIGAFFMLPFIIGGIWLLKYTFTDKGDEEHFIGGAFSLIIGVFLFSLFLVNGLDLALNPSYWALRDILEMVRGH